MNVVASAGVNTVGLSMLLSDPIVQRLGWTLVHTLWQGVILAAALAGVLRFPLRSAPANIRYIASCAALAMMVFAAGFTFTQVRVAVAGVVEPKAMSLTHPIAAAPRGDVAPLVLPSTINLAAAPRAPHDTRNEVLRVVVLLWAIGVAILSLWHIGGWILLRSVRGGGGSLEQWQPVMKRLADRLGIRRAVRLIETARIDVPAVVGVLRPMIVVPVGVLSGLAPQQVEAILAHELAHVRRHDYLVNLIQAAVETLMFYHPATWWISAQIRQERENCCDDIAATLCGDGAVYASALAALEERRGPRIGRGDGALAVAATGGNLLARVRRILKLPPAAAGSRNRIRSLAAAVVALACVALPMLVMAQAEQKPKEEKPKEDKLAVTKGTLSLQSDAGITFTDFQASSILPEDTVAKVEDYRTGPGDLLSVSVTDLVGPGVETVKNVRVSDTGIISMPIVGTIKVDGMTPPEIEKAVQKAYRDANLLPNAQVSATVTDATRRRFNVLGQVDKPGQYSIQSSDLRLLDALAQAGARSGDFTALHVIRQENGKQRRIEIPVDRLTAGDAAVNVVIRPGDTIMAAAAPKDFVKVVIGKESLLLDGKPIELEALAKKFEGMPAAQRRGTVLEIAAAAPDVTVERYFKVSARLSQLVKEHKLAYLSETGIQPTTEPAAEPGTERGEYYMNGVVKRTGVYSLTARKISLKQAVAAAGGLETGTTSAFITVIRRQGNGEVLAADNIPLDDLMSGKASDIFLRPYDFVRVTPQKQPFTPTTKPAATAPAAEKQSSSVAPVDQATIGRIAAADPTMLEYLRTKEAIEFNLARLSQSYGSNNPTLRNAQRHLDLQNRRIQDYAVRYLQHDPAAATQPAGAAGPPDALMLDFSRQHASAQMQVELMKQRYRADHPSLRKAQQELDLLDMKIAEHAGERPNDVAPPPPIAADAPDEATKVLTDCMSNLRRVHGAILFYANDNGAKLPPDLGATLKYSPSRALWEPGQKKDEWTEKDKALSYVCPDDPNAKQVPEKPTPQWINQNSSYVYLGGGNAKMDNIKGDGGKVVLAYEKRPEGHKGLVPVLFLDGHVSAEKQDQVKELVDASTKLIDAAKEN